MTTFNSSASGAAPPQSAHPAPVEIGDNLTKDEQGWVAPPIAVCGIALRLPGGISTPSQFWDFLVNKQDARGPIPETRFKASSFYSKSGKPGFIKTQHGYFLDESVDLGALDTSFFSMSKTEVERVDPQQRLLLELAWECFESAGERDYRGRAIGTYIGSFGEDWAENFTKDPNIFGSYKITGYGDFTAPNRISYEYDLRGPSMTIRTGCSSGLIGLHEACRAIQSGDCSAALVGGCNLIMSPGMTVSMSEQGILSPDGSCKTFDADANGYARGEAINLVYIKKLDDALRDGNPIRAVIAGTATNADGKTTGISVPSHISHEAMIRRAYSTAGLADRCSQTAFVECHGTGTAAGDPIEAKAVANVFGDEGVFIGSVKPNLGHSEGASGITSLVKAILALEHRTIPPNIKFRNPNPKIPFEEKKLRVPLEPIPWPEDRHERISVNSFGIGGANAHVVLDSVASYLAQSTPEKIALPTRASLHLVPFSANTADSLRSQVERHRDYLTENPESVADVAYTLAVRRVHLPHRAYSVMGASTATDMPSLSRIPSATPRLAMVFTGQGAQWPQMGMQLMQANATFASSIRHMDKVLRGLADGPSWSIESEILATSETSKVMEASYSQPLCTALQVALFDALSNLGIQPYAVIGHSSGEIAAAYASGRLTSAQAITIAFYRGMVSSEIETPGRMAVVGMSWSETSSFLLPGVSIACGNAPANVTISGDEEGVEKVVENIRHAKPDVFCRLLQVDTAYHSHHMKAVGARYLSLVSREMPANLKPASNGPLFFSTVTGTQLPSSTDVNARYWQTNLESPVLFHKAVDSLLDYHLHVQRDSTGLAFLEVGPHSALGGPLRQILSHSSSNHPYKSCLTRYQDAEETLLLAAGWLWTHGIHINFDRLTNIDGTAKTKGDLPTYPWKHDHSMLLETRITKAWRFRQERKHELLGVRVPESTDNEPVFHNVLLLEHVPWLRDHFIRGNVIFPGAGYIGMVGEAVRQLSHDASFAGFDIRNLVIDMALVLHESKPTEIITSLRKERLTDSLESSWWDFTVSSHNGVAWTKHCAGQVRPVAADEDIETRQTLQEAPAKFARIVEPKDWYRALAKVEGNYGPCFQGLGKISCSATDCTANATTCRTVHDDEAPYFVHPTQIDVFLQLIGLASVKGLGHKLDKMTVPTFIEKVHVAAAGQDEDLDMTVSASTTDRGSVGGMGNALTLAGQMALTMSGVKLRPLQDDDPEDHDPHAGARLFWEPDIDFLDPRGLIEPYADQKKYIQVCEELNLLCIHEALRRVGDLTTEVPHLRRFQAWLREQRPATTSEGLEMLSGRLSNTVAGPIAAALTKVLDNIVPIFESKVEPVDVLMSGNTLTALYDTLGLTKRTRLFQSLGHSKPNLRILEVGAGTGGTTAAALASLVHEATGARMYWYYDYTDISAGFFNEAQDRFMNHANIRYRALDITKDPLEQGFEAGAYDLVIASNVLHTTPSLRHTLANVRKLLHPEGTLYLEELCSEVKVFNFIMGILPGWWSGVDDGRVSEPYVSPERWDAELRGAGFDGLQSVSYDCPPPHQLLAMMTAKPTSDVAKKTAATILYDDASLNVAETLKACWLSEDYQVSLRHLSDQESPLDTDIISVVDVDRPFFEDITSSAYNDFHVLVAKLSESGAAIGLLWLTRSSHLRCTDPRWGQIIGAARTIRGEMAIDIATCEIDEPLPSVWPLVINIFQKFQRRRSHDVLLSECEYAILDGTVYIPRAFPVLATAESEKERTENDSNRAQDLMIGRYGRLKTLAWETRPSRSPEGSQVMIETKAVGLNFKDVLIAMGIVDSTTKGLGLEAAGVVREVGPDVKDLAVGDRVFVFGGNCFSTHLIISEAYCARIPEDLSFEAAATMPCVYSTVFHGLIDIGRLEAGQTVLIHSACGGVGLAAIQVCKWVGVEIYCTVGSEEKIRHLESAFEIPRSRIFNSREPSFLDRVLEATSGRGVDLVLNSLSGELLHASWKCVAEFGKMIEIGKRDLIGNGKLDLNVFEANRSYHGVDLGLLIERKPHEATRLLKKIVEVYHQGHICPISPVREFPSTAIQDAFRYMQKGQHIGKIIVSIEPHEAPTSCATASFPTPEFNSRASYLLVGGLGGLGRVVSTWMVENGARHLVYLSRSAGVSSEHQAFFEELRSQGCSVTAVSGSVSNLSDVEAALAAAPTPVRGVLNMSMVLGDSNFATMTYNEWTRAVEPKVRGTWNLHNACLSRNLDLDFFMLFSSISAIIGQRGQANYAGANAFMDAFVKYRHGLDLKAGSLAIGLITDQGVMAEHPVLRERLISQGNHGLQTPQLLDAIGTTILAQTLGHSSNGRAAQPIPLVIGLKSVLPLDDPSNRVIWKRDRRMAAYYNHSLTNSDSSREGSSGTSSALTEFLYSARLDPRKLAGPEAATFLARQIGRQMLELLMRPSASDDDIDVSASLQDIGLDSLVAIELRSWWKGVFGFDLGVMEMLSTGNLLALGEKAIQGLKETYGEGTSQDEAAGQPIFEAHEILQTKMP